MKKKERWQRWRKTKKKSEWRKNKRKRKRDKKGYIKKGEWERKGARVSQLALHTSKAVLCAHLQAAALHFSRKTFHRLAPPNLALARLQSLAITLIHYQLCIVSLAAQRTQRRGMLLLRSRALLLQPIWHMLICKERGCTLHIQSQSIVPMDHAT